MSFPKPDLLKSYLAHIISIQAESSVQPLLWHNAEWLPGVEAFGSLHSSGDYWTAVFTSAGAMIKSFSKDEENDFGYININTLPDWAREIYQNPMWQAEEITSLAVGFNDGVWEEPWLAKAWWPLYPLHNALPFNEENYKKWISDLELDLENHPYSEVNKLWSFCYKPPQLEWCAVDESLPARTDSCSPT